MQMSTVQHWDWEILPARHCGNHASPGIFWVIFLRCSNSTYASLPDVVPYGEVFHRQSPFSLPGCCVLNFDICVRSLWAKSMHFYGSKSYAYGFRCGNCSWDTPSAKPCGLVKAQQGPCHRTLHDWFPYPPNGQSMTIPHQWRLKNIDIFRQVMELWLICQCFPAVFD